MKSEKTLMESKPGHVFQYARRVALSGPGKLMLAVAVMASLMSIPLPSGADDRDGHDGNKHDQNDRDDRDDRDGDESRIQRGFAIAPVRLDLRGKNRKLVGLGSYIVNAQGGCNDCHTAPPFAPGGDPHLGEPKQVNAAAYLGGGTHFGPVIVSKNITPDANGRPAGLTRDQFITLLRTGRDEGRILQVMPWPVYGEMTDGDLKAIYEYLMSIPRLEGLGPR